jgi:hypothetical protein
MSKYRPQVGLTARGGASRSIARQILSRRRGYNSGPFARQALRKARQIQSLGPVDHPPFELPDAIVDSLLKQFAQSSQLGANAAYIEDLYEQYLVDPDSVGPKWKAYFDGFKGREKLRDLLGAAQVDVHRFDRRRVHAHHRRRTASLDAGAPGNRRRQLRRTSKEARLRILERLTAAEGLERYLHTKYVGQKRFSLEGGESADPDARRDDPRAGSRASRSRHRHGPPRPPQRAGQHARQAAAQPVRRVRRQVRTCPTTAPLGRRQVPHGLQRRHRHPGGPVHLALAFNPSHLEIVDPVVVGSVRARQRPRGDAADRATRCCRSSCTATPRSPARAW